jgi:hypothetical protein
MANQGSQKGRTVAKGAKSTQGSRKVKPYSPASNLLYGRGAGSAQPSAPEEPSEAEPMEYSKKSVAFWIISCLVAGLGIYLFFIVYMAGSGKPADVAANPDESTPTEQQAQAPSPSPAPTPESVPLDARTPVAPTPAPAPAPTPATEAAGPYTVRIIQVPGSMKSNLQKILLHQDMREAIGGHPTFIVTLRRGDIVGCVGRFDSPNDPEARRLAERMNNFVLNRQQPFKGAMVWKYE